MRMTLADILQHTNGVCIRPNVKDIPDSAKLIQAVSIDSRTLTADSLFVCIKGNHTDGHEHIQNAISNGVAAVLVDNVAAAVLKNTTEAQNASITVPVILVENTVKALGMLANAHRKDMHGSVIAVTGTAGKTTVKELLWHLLQSVGKTAKNIKNFNNQIGLPLSMLAADSDCDYWVMEVGISEAHDMDELGAILQADKVLILNAGVGHTAGLGDKGVAYHKASLIKYLTDKGESLVSADYPELTHQAQQFQENTDKKKKTTQSFFSASTANVPYTVEYKDDGHFHLSLDREKLVLPARFPAAFAENIIAVASMAHRLGVSTKAIANGLSTAILPSQRFQQTTHNGWSLIDDSYNANPLSSKRSIEASVALAKGKTLVCVMGEMAELGEYASKEHVTLGKQLAVADIIFWVGNHLDHIREGLESQKFKGVIIPCATTEAFIQGLCTQNLSSGVILFKGSRSNTIERFIEAFMIHLQTKHCA